jgi:hypothetical protein
MTQYKRENLLNHQFKPIISYFFQILDRKKSTFFCGGGVTLGGGSEALRRCRPTLYPGVSRNNTFLVLTYPGKPPSGEEHPEMFDAANMKSVKQEDIKNLKC